MSSPIPDYTAPGGFSGAGLAVDSVDCKSIGDQRYVLLSRRYKARVLHPFVWIVTSGILLANNRAHAGIDDDPVSLLASRLARSSSLDVFLGDGEWGEPSSLAIKLQDVMEVQYPEEQVAMHGAILSSWLAPELYQRNGTVSWQKRSLVFRPLLEGTAGKMIPVNSSGDEEDGVFSFRGNLDLRAYVNRLEFVLSPLVGADFAGVMPDTVTSLHEGWFAWRTEHLLAGLGLRDRWLGPGRRGSLLLSNNAFAVPMASVAVQGHIPGWASRLGKLRWETSVGWFNRPRTDVDNPGLLLMDARWLPVPSVEIGATRMSMFWGEGRPWPGLVNLLFPFEPHVYDDPEKEEPDQNEIASLDFRVTVPITQFLGGPVDWVETWWQYGAEDIIAREFAGIPYPSLAGVANLAGIEINAGDLTLAGEWARIFDDYFRWYVSHRVYYDGFTQDGRIVGHEAGPDSESLWFRLGFFPSPWGMEIWTEGLHRVGVIEFLGSNLLALSTDEFRRRVGLDAWRFSPKGSSWKLECSMEWVRGQDFVPENAGFSWRLALTWRGADIYTGSNAP